MPSPILNVYGKPFSSQRDQRIVRNLQAKFDAAQTDVKNQLHWAQADSLDPHAAASLDVRKKLRSRSRYEVIENNPYLKGTILSIANDFVGSGPKLQITDKRLSPEQRKQIANRWNQEYCKIIKLRQMLWRMVIATIVDGESFSRPYILRRSDYPIKLRWQVLECDRITSWDMPNKDSRYNEIDGVRFDQYDNPVYYHILNYHPGSNLMNYFSNKMIGGQWVRASNIIHWFRQDRGWLRGIPELTPSLPLCAVLRRYTMATLLHKEVAASYAAFLKSNSPPNASLWTDGTNLVDEDPFDTMPIEMGSITSLPWDTEIDQLNPVPDGTHYDEFVGSILREIVRPILVPFNVSSGSSKDSNMASGVLDNQIYSNGQKSRRLACNEDVLDPLANQWWYEGIRVGGYFDVPRTYLLENPLLSRQLPAHTWRYDPVGLEHTDPVRVAESRQIMAQERMLTQRDIQEIYHNRDVDDWRDEVREDIEFEKEIGIFNEQEETAPPGFNDPPTA